MAAGAGVGRACARVAKPDPDSRQNLVADFDLGTLMLCDFRGARRGVARELQERLPLALPQHDRIAGVAADADLRVERELGQEVHLHLLRRAPAAAVAE